MRVFEDASVLELRMEFDRERKRHARALSRQRIWWLMTAAFLSTAGFFLGRYGVVVAVRTFDNTLARIF